MSLFSVINGVEVYSGEQKLWRCPHCAWWLDWDKVVCPACKLKRPQLPDAAKSITSTLDASK